MNKFLYGIKLPFTDHRLPGIRAPQRGDVVVFTVARDPRAGRARAGSIRPTSGPDLPTDSFMKRIIGMPGDVVEVRAGAVAINGTPIAPGADGRDLSRRSRRAARS